MTATNGNGRGPNIEGLTNLAAALRTESGRAMFNLESWFRGGAFAPRKAFAAGGKCGTTACIQGMAAIIDKRWKIAMTEGKYPIASFNGAFYEEAFSKWARIPQEDAEVICDPGSGLWERENGTTSIQAADMLDRYVANGCSLVGIFVEEES